MEGDGPTGCMVLRKYYQLRKNLKKKMSKSNKSDTLYPMYLAMSTSVDKYLSEALECETIILATVLHPSWRTNFFATAFGSDSDEFKIATNLLQTCFARRKLKLQVSQHDSPVEQVNQDDSDDDAFNLKRKKKVQTVQDELSRWIEADDAPDEEVALDPKKALLWWKVMSLILFIHLLLIC